MTDKIVANILEGCPYSINAEKLLNKYNADYKKVDVNYMNKYDKEFEIMKTFPQIYLDSKDGKKYILGGYDNLKSFYDNYETIEKSNSLKVLDTLGHVDGRKSIILKMALNLLNGLKR
mgnify:CR=1 FL=1